MNNFLVSPLMACIEFAIVVTVFAITILGFVS